MQNVKSLVYQDTVIQKILKDILIPVIGYRDVSKPLGQYTEDFAHLDDRVTALEIPDKSKIYIHNSSLEPIVVALPKTAYGTMESFYEPVMVEIELSYTGDSVAKRLAVGVLMPSELYTNTNGSIKPLIVYCNQESRDVLGTVVVNSRVNYDQEVTNVYEIYFPKITEETNTKFSRAVVTITSEHRGVTKDTSWTQDVISGSTLNNTNELILGMVSIEEPIANPDKLVYSDNIRAILSISKGAYSYLSQTDQTIPTTLYLEREDKASRNTGRLYIRSADEIKNNYQVLANIFGKDWSGIEFEFDPSITSIDGCFENLDITHTPKALISNTIKSANRLFKGSSIEVIADQSTLLSKMPLLTSVNEIFNDCVNLTGEITKELISSNLLLDSIDRGFRNTKITNVFDIWNYTHTYQPARDPAAPPSYPDPDPITVYITGKACFEGVTTLINIDSIPQFWRFECHNYEYVNMANFNQFKERLLAEYDNNLSSITIEFTTHTELDNMFSSTPITHTPMAVISDGATSAISMFGYCTELISVSRMIISLIPTLTDISSFVSGASSLPSLPEGLLYDNKAIDNYAYAFSGLTSMTGDTPKTSSGLNLWEVAGTEGYPAEISGLDCFKDSVFDNMSSVPSGWGGTGE